MADDTGSWLSLCGVTMSGTYVPDQGIKFLNLIGAWGLTAARGRPDSIPGGHGQYRRGSVLREARAMTIYGEFRAETNVELKVARSRLTAALAAGIGPMILSTPSEGMWEREVEIDRFTPEPDHGRTVAKFTIDVVAPDPRRYGPWQSVGPVGMPQVSGGMRLPQRFPWNFGKVSDGGRLEVPNAGELDMFPIFHISGGFESVTVRDITAGRRLTLDWPVAESDSVTIDSGVRRTEMSGAEVTRWMTSRQWFAIPPGETHEFRVEMTGRLGDPLMSASYRIGAW